jgi:pimeloyl-ACP methyl ester carboxylesterase
VEKPMKLRTRCNFLLSLLLLSVPFLNAQDAQNADTSRHSIQMIAVEPDVKLEVLDWGGTGPPLILLAGLGDTAHIFDQFAPKLAATYHVYGITRRGFGKSSKPAPVTENYSSARLGNDVLAVIGALHLDHPIVAGHSLAGEELSYIGFHHPDAVAGLIYLDAGYLYALYDQVQGSYYLNAIQLRDELAKLIPGKIPDNLQEHQNNVQEIVQQLQQLQNELTQYLDEMKLSPPSPARRDVDKPPVMYAIFSGQEKIPTIQCPALFIFADPHDLGPSDHSAQRVASEAHDLRTTENQVKAVERQVPRARVVRIAHANHYVFVSNELDVIREMSAFVSTLPQPLQ